MEPGIEQIKGENILEISKQFENALSVEDLLELKEVGYKVLYCVYTDWKDFTKCYIESVMNNAPDDYKKLFKFIDVEKAAASLSGELGKFYTELESGKIVQGDIDLR